MSDFRVSHVVDDAGRVVPWFRAGPEQPGLRCAFCRADIIWRRDSIWQDSGEKRASAHFAHRPGSGCVEDPSLEVIGGPSVLHQHYVAAVVEILKSDIEWLAHELQKRHRIELPRGEVDVERSAPGGTYVPDVGVHPKDGTDQRFLGVEVVYKHAPDDGRRMQAKALNHDGIAFDVKEGLKAHLDDVSEGEGALGCAVKFLRKVGFTLIHNSDRRFNLIEIAKWKNLSASDLAAMTCVRLQELASDVWAMKARAKEAAEAATNANMMRMASEAVRKEYEAERLREDAIRRWQLEYEAGEPERAAAEAEAVRVRAENEARRAKAQADEKARLEKEAAENMQRVEAEWLSNPANVWLRENRKADPAEHEAEMLRTALLHQAEFQRTGKRTVFGNGGGGKP